MLNGQLDNECGVQVGDINLSDISSGMVFKVMRLDVITKGVMCADKKMMSIIC